MIEIKIGLDGIPSTKKIVLGNRWENKDEKIHFDLPTEFDGYYKYIYAVMPAKSCKELKEDAYEVLPITDNIFIVSSRITRLAGAWNLYLVAKEKPIDLSANEIDMSAQDGEHVFVSDGFIGVIANNLIDKETVENLPMDSNLKSVYDELLFLKDTILDKINSGGASSGNDYDGISGKPKINGVELNGNQTLYDFKYIPTHSIDVKSYPALYLAIKKIGLSLDEEDDTCFFVALLEDSLSDVYNGEIVTVEPIRLMRATYSPVHDISTIVADDFTLTVDMNGIVSFEKNDNSINDQLLESIVENKVEAIVEQKLETKMDTDLGVENAGKVLVVGEDGRAVYVEASSLVSSDSEDVDNMLEEVFGNG